MYRGGGRRERARNFFQIPKTQEMKKYGEVKSKIESSKL